MKTRIAIIENDLALSKSLKHIIQASSDFICLGQFSTVQEAINILPDLKVQIVLSNVNLADGKGTEVLQFLMLRNDISCPDFVMFTNCEDDKTLFDALNLGAIGYLLKKDYPDIILPALREVVQGGTPMSIGIARKALQLLTRRGLTNPCKSKGRMSILSPRELQILGNIDQGLLYKEVAANLNITIGTVKQHLHTIYKKLKVSNKTEAINIYKKGQ